MRQRFNSTFTLLHNYTHADGFLGIVSLLCWINNTDLCQGRRSEHHFSWKLTADCFDFVKLILSLTYLVQQMLQRSRPLRIWRYTWWYLLVHLAISRGKRRQSRESKFNQKLPCLKPLRGSGVRRAPQILLFFLKAPLSKAFVKTHEESNKFIPWNSKERWVMIKVELT